MENLDASICPQCEGWDLQTVMSVPDVDHFERVATCRICGLTSLLPCPTSEQVKGFYRHHGHWKLLSDKHERVVHGRRLTVLRGLYAGYPGVLFEIGPSDGLFLKCAAEQGWKVKGIEPAAEDVVQARLRGVDVVEGFFDSKFFGDADCDVVVMWDVLEHCQEPAALLKAAFSHVRPGGLLAISIPNIEGLPARLFRSAWWYRMSPKHIHFFTRKWLEGIANANAASIVGMDGFLKIQSLARGLFPESLFRLVLKVMPEAPNASEYHQARLETFPLSRGRRLGQLFRRGVLALNQRSMPFLFTDLIEVWFRVG